MKRTTVTTAGLVLAGLLGLGDVIGIVTGGVDGPPFPVLIAGAVLGVITLVGVVLGWRGSRAGIVTVIVTRLLSALTAVPAFFVDDVPAARSASPRSAWRHAARRRPARAGLRPTVRAAVA